MTPFLWIGFYWLKATEELAGDNLLFMTQLPGVLDTDLINPGKMKS